METTGGTASRIADYGSLAVSILTLATFAVAFILAYWKQDQQSVLLLVGAIVANATTTVGFWLGSSNGSQKKDATIAAQANHNPFGEWPVASLPKE